MPHLGITAWAIWSAAIALQPAISIIMVIRRLWQRWFSVFVFFSFKSAATFALLGITTMISDQETQAWWYFWVYWLTLLVADLLVIWVAADLGCELAGWSGAARSAIRKGVCVLASACLSFCFLLSFQMPMSPYGRFVCVVVDLSKAVSLGLLLMFLVIITVSEIAGILLDKTVLCLLIGLTLNATGETLMSWIASLHPSWPVSEVQGAFYAAALVVWTATFLKTQNSPEQLPTLAGVRAALWQYHLATERLKRRS